MKATVDAGDNVIVQDGKLRLQHIDWSLPKDISINGIRWKPEWKDNKSDDFTAFNPSLAPFAGSNVTVSTEITQSLLNFIALLSNNLL